MKLNRDAIVAWLYIREASRECPFEASQDRDFFMFVVDMCEHYYPEFEAMDNVTHVQRWFEEKK